jgi:hypothetical protein
MSEIKFSAQVSAARDKWLKLASEYNIDAALEFLRSNYSNEKNDNRRLGNLAAQTWIIRKRLTDFPLPSNYSLALLLQKPTTKTHDSELKSQSALETQDTDKNNVRLPERSMRVVNISEEVQINEMKFFAGSRVEVSEEDARRLVEAGKATVNES